MTKKIWSIGLRLNYWRSAIARTLLVAFVVPLGSPEDWKSLSFRKIKANKVAHSTQGLHIAVEGSASPLIYKLDQPKKVKKIKIQGRWQGMVSFSESQGEKGFDDFLMRVGLVRRGDKILNFFQKKIAPEWVLEMHKLAPPGVGVSHIDFFCLYHSKKWANQSRQHPLSDLIREHFVWSVDKEGEFELTHEFKSPEETLGLWLSSDGDDTGAKYDLYLHRIELEFDEGTK